MRGVRNPWGTCVWLQALSAAFPLSNPERGGRVFSAGSTLRPISLLSCQPGFVCGGYAVGCAPHSIRREGGRMAGCGDQIKGKKQGFAAFFNLNVFYSFILLFQARVSRDLFSPTQKPRHRFCLRGRRIVRESPESLRIDLGFLFISIPVKIVFSWLAYQLAANNILERGAM